ncbi:MAG: hypothetical protein KGL78_07310, partial [Burkholderiales bacterium]|nr:hypothetical protein [Burkholderiales bacterium]
TPSLATDSWVTTRSASLRAGGRAPSGVHSARAQPRRHSACLVAQVLAEQAHAAQLPPAKEVGRPGG